MKRCYQVKEAPVQVGERLRWGRNDAERGLINGAIGTVTEIDGNKVTLSLDSGKTALLDASVRSDRHFDYGYAATAYGAQGATGERVILHAESWRINLTNARSFYVGVSRAQGETIVVTDDAGRLAASIGDRAGGKMAALDGQVIHEAAARAAPDHKLELVLAEARWEALKDIIDQRAIRDLEKGPRPDATPGAGAAENDRSAPNKTGPDRDRTARGGPDLTQTM